MLKKFEKIPKFWHLCPGQDHVPENFWNFLSIAVFCEVKATKHCNAQKIPKFPTPKLTKHYNAQKIPKIPKFWHLCPGQDQIPKKLWNF